MNVNIYYGGRGLVDDPTVTVLNKITDVLNELRVNVEKYNLFELKNSITTLPQTLKDADAVILASTVEWFGIGGYMTQFLDACWLYADKSMIEKIYMFPIVMSRASGEKEASMSLSNAWELLGGQSCNGLSGYVADPVEFELNPEYQSIFEKKAEEIYRTVSQKAKTLPSSNNAIKSNIVSDTMRLTPQESEQLSKYASDDTYIKKQKEDIEELASMFRDLMSDEDKGGIERYAKLFNDNFVPQSDFKASYVINISDKKKTMIIEIDNRNIDCRFGQKDDAEVTCRLDNAVLEKIVQGNQTFQGAFMSGSMTAKGNFKNIRMLDQCFKF